MAKNAQVTPFTDAMINMPQEEAENSLFGNGNFREVKEMVQRVVEEVENLKDGEEREQKKRALLRKIVELPENRRGTIFTAMRCVSGNSEDKIKNANIAKKRYERFLSKNGGDESQKESVWKTYNNLGVIAFDEENYEEAIKYMLEAKEFEDRNYILGMSYFFTDDYQKAILFLEAVEARENDDDFTYACYTLTHIHFEEYINGDDTQTSKVVETGKIFLEHYDEETMGIERWYNVNYMIGVVLRENGGKEYLEKVTEDADIKIYGGAQRALGIIEGLEIGKENS